MDFFFFFFLRFHVVDENKHTAPEIIMVLKLPYYSYDRTSLYIIASKNDLYRTVENISGYKHPLLSTRIFKHKIITFDLIWGKTFNLINHMEVFYFF